MAGVGNPDNTKVLLFFEEKTIYDLIQDLNLRDLNYIVVRFMIHRFDPPTLEAPQLGTHHQLGFRHP
jgi:hypothetical protein